MAIENNTTPERCRAAVEAERLSHAVSEAAQSLAALIDLLRQDARHVDNNGWNYSGGLADLLQGISDKLFSEKKKVDRQDCLSTPAVSQIEAAEIFGVAVRSVRNAKTTLQNDPELHQAAVSEAAQSLAALIDLLRQDARHVDNNGWNYSGGLADLLQGISDKLFSEWGKTPCKAFDCQHEHAGSVEEEPRP